MTITDRLTATCRAAAPGIVGVSTGRVGDSSTVEVQPAGLQSICQSVIDTFDWTAAAQLAWEEDQHPERKTLRQAASGAVADIDTYLALASPTNAQVVAQVRRLSQDVRALIKRLVQLD